MSLAIEVDLIRRVPMFSAIEPAKTRLEALRVCKDLFLDLVRDNAEVALQLNRILAVRLANTTSQLSVA